MSGIRLFWTRVHTSLWFLPAVLTAAAIGLALLTLAIDRSGVLSGADTRVLFGAGAEGARGVLSTIAGSIITVTGVVFSITIVVLQLASSQYSPRVLQSFTEDRANQLVLGVFIGTFTYALLVLRTVRSTFEDSERFVPALSVTVALLLALISIGCLIFFVNHIARSIEAESIIERAAGNARRVVDHLFPESGGSPAEIARPDIGAQLDTAGLPVRVEAAGYLQDVDVEGVLRLADRHGLVVRMERRIGEFLLPADVLFSVLPRTAGENVLGEVRSCATLGPARTRHHDLERSLVELTDIGIRALSPGMNDPTTAMASIDRVTEVLALLATRSFPALQRTGADGELRFVGRRREFADFVEGAYAPLIHHARRDPHVSARIRDSLEALMARVPTSRRDPFAAQLLKLDVGKDAAGGDAA
jgi:uncharacterized membrane protein